MDTKLTDYRSPLVVLDRDLFVEVLALLSAGAADAQALAARLENESRAAASRMVFDHKEIELELAEEATRRGVVIPDNDFKLVVQTVLYLGSERDSGLAEHADGLIDEALDVPAVALKLQRVEDR